MSGPVTNSASSTATKASPGPAYYSIEARGPWGTGQTAAIADALATIHAHKANGYVASKEVALRTEIAAANASVLRLEAGVKLAQTAAQALAKSVASDASAAALLATHVSQVSHTTRRSSPPRGNRLSQDRLLLASAVDIEAASIANVAFGHPAATQPKLTSLIKPVFAGLIIGTLLAFFWDLWRRRHMSAAVPS